MIGTFFWDPDPVAFTIPGINHPVVWYGILFALGFFVGYRVTCRLVARRFSDAPNAAKLATAFTDRLLWTCAIGTVVGARLGHAILYDSARYLAHPIDLFKVWEGGLASHGAAVGVLLSLLFFRAAIARRYPPLSFLQLLDIVVIPTALIGGFIRVGNFCNQELIGTVTAMPWGVVFGHAADGSWPMGRHPVQLYEATAYFGIFALLVALYYRDACRSRTGLLSGLFFVTVFTARFGLEFYKERFTSLVSQESALAMGQVLSLPFIIIGVVLLVWSLRRRHVSVS